MSVIVADAVRFDIGFIDDVEPVAITEVVPLGDIGIVRGSDRVDVVPLHNQDVADHPLGAHDVGRVGIVLVAVGSLEQHRNAVDQELPSRDLDLSKTDVAGDRLNDGTTGS